MVHQTNPPFGGKAKLDECPSFRPFPTDVKLIQAGGQLVIILSGSIFNNPGLKFIRSWIPRRAKLAAARDLQKTTSDVLLLPVIVRLPLDRLPNVLRSRFAVLTTPYVGLTGC